MQDLTDTCGTLVCPVCGEVNEEEEGGGGPTEYSVNRLALSLISTNKRKYKTIVQMHIHSNVSESISAYKVEPKCKCI